MTHLHIRLRLSPARPRRTPRLETYVPDLAQRRIAEVSAELEVPIEHIVGPSSPWQGGRRAIRARQVVAYALHELDGLTYRQIAEALGLKYQTAVQRVQRARIFIACQEPTP
jgi:hypothetical protein